MSSVNEASHGLSRALALIEFMSLYPRGLSLAGICQETGLAKSSAHRLLRELTAQGYVVQSPDGLYSLSFKFCELSSRILAGLDIVLIAIPYIKQLCESVSEVVHLVVPNGTDIVYLRKEEPVNNTIKVMSYAGMRRPMYITAAGKSMLSCMPEAQVRAIWDKTEIVKVTDNTILSLDRLLSELDVIRARGYAVDNEENEIGVRCIGAAIRNYENSPVGAVSISAPVRRLDRERIEELSPKLKQVVDSISREMGCKITLS